MLASVWVCGLLLAIGIVAVGWFRSGRALYAVGGNPAAAKAAGIRVDRAVVGDHLFYFSIASSVTAAPTSRFVIKRRL